MGFSKRIKWRLYLWYKRKITDLGVQNSSVKLFAKDTILFSFKLSIGKTAIVGNPLYTNEAIAGILSKIMIY